MSNLQAAIAEYLSVYAEAMAALGTDEPELDPRIDQALRDKIVRQRAKVNATLSGVAPEVHVAHVEALTSGLRVVLRRLAPAKPKTPAPPMPVWDDRAKAWRVPDPGQVDTPTGPDDRIDDLF